MDRYCEWRKIIMSDVNNFDINNYNLFIHAVNLDDKYSSLIRSNIAKTNNYSEVQASIDIRKNPFDIAKRNRISTSFVSSKQKRDFPCYGRVGFILNVPIENIMYVGFDGRYEKTNEELRNMQLLSPQDIIDGKVLFNQVIVEGTTEYGKVVPMGIFVDYSGIYNELSKMDNNEWERNETNHNLQKLIELTGDIFPIIDITSYRNLNLSRVNSVKGR